MGEDQNKSEEDRFEEGLRQILSGGPAHGGKETDADRPNPPPRPKLWTPENATEKAEAQRKALFWFKLMRPLAMVALLVLLAMFVMRITAER